MKCYQHYKQFNDKCQKKSCRYWIECNESKNCTLIKAENDTKLTLEDVGKLFNVTRMRICQIEKLAVKKLREKVKAMI